MPFDPELTKIFGDDFTSIFESAMSKMDDSASLIMQQGLTNAVFDARKFGVEIQQRVAGLQAQGLASSEIKKLIDRDLKEAGRIFGSLKNSTKETLSNGINQSGRAGQFEAYKPTDLLAWVTVGGHKVCPDCGSRAGEVHTVAEWETLGLPGTGWSVCRGYCYCILDPSGKIDREVKRPDIKPEKGAKIRPKGRELSKMEKLYSDKPPPHGNGIYGLTQKQIAEYKRITELRGKTAEQMLKRKGITRKQALAESDKARERLLKLGQTKKKYFNEKTGKWTRERAKLHRKIANEVVGKVDPAKAGEMLELLMTGGYPGSGKSTVLDQAFPGWRKKFVHLDSDALKVALAKADGIDNLGWRAYAYHTEADDVMKLILELAEEQNKHILLDQTMKSKRKVINALRRYKEELGYNINVAYADLPMQQTIERAIARFVGDAGSFNGRFVDPLYILTHGTQNIETFESAKRWIDSWVHYSTNVSYGSDALVVATYP